MAESSCFHTRRGSRSPRATLAGSAGGFLTTAAHVAATELAEHGITSNVVVPGYTEGEGFVEGIPAGRLANSTEIAAVGRLPRLGGCLLRERRRDHGRRRLHDHQDGRRQPVAPVSAAASIGLACTDNTFRLVEPWESALKMIALLELERVDVCLTGQPLPPAARGRPR